MECQIGKVTSKACHNDAIASIDLTNTNKGDFYNLLVCEQHLRQLTQQAETVTDKTRERGW